MTTRKLSTDDLKLFRTTLERVGVDKATEIDMDLADVYFDDDQFRMSQVPSAVPANVRVIIKDLVQQKQALQRQLDGLMDSLMTVSSAVVTRLEKEAEAEKPHCMACGQVITKKARR